MRSRARADSPIALTRTRCICADQAPAQKKSMRSTPRFRFFPATTSEFPSASSDVDTGFESRAVAQLTQKLKRGHCHSVVSLRCNFYFATQKTFTHRSRCSREKGRFDLTTLYPVLLMTMWTTSRLTPL